MRAGIGWTGPFADALLAHRGAALALCLMGTLAMAGAATRLEFSSSPETILESTDADLVALRSHERVFGTFEHRLVLVVRAEDVFAPEMLARLRLATDRLLGLPEVAAVRSLASTGFPLPDPENEPSAFRRAVHGNRLLTPFLVSRDGRTAALHVDLAPAFDEPKRRAAAIDAVTAEARECGLDPLVAGVPAVRRAYAEFILDDLLLLPPLVTLLLAALLFLALTAILPALICVVGIATGVHVVARFGEERERGASPREAARAAMVAMALPCGLTSLTTAVGFSSLVVAGIRDVREFGVYSAAGALFAFLLGVPLVGILLSFGASEGRRPPGLFARPLRLLGLALLRRPRAGTAVGVAVALAAVIGLLRLESDTFLLEDIRADSAIYRATKLVDAELGGVIGFDLVIDAPAGLVDVATIGWITAFEQRLAGIDGGEAVLGPGVLVAEASRAAVLDPGVPPSRILAAIRARGGAETVDAFVDREGRTARVAIRTGDVGSTRAKRIREEALALFRRDAPPGMKARAAGLAILAETVLSRLVSEMGKSLALAFAVIFLLMSLLFRSVRVGALSMVPNFLPLLVAGGFMGFAGIKVRSSIALIFAVALGLAVDDTIHVLTRYLRERAAGRPVRTAVYRTIRWTGRPVTLTSIVLLVGFLSFMSSGFKATSQFGLISAVTIAAALVGDLVVLPALLLRRR